MPQVAPFHSVNEASKPPEHRVFHSNGACGTGRDIPYRERVSGSGHEVWNGWRLSTPPSQGRGRSSGYRRRFGLRGRSPIVDGLLTIHLLT